MAPPENPVNLLETMEKGKNEVSKSEGSETSRMEST